MLAQYKLVIMVIVVVLIIVVVKLKVKKSKEKELKIIAEDKLRDAALNKALANQLYNTKENTVNVESIPYEVDYNQGLLESHVNHKNKVMLQITECSELSRRKFMIELKGKIKIGRAKENAVVIKEPRALPVQCEIFTYHNAVYVRSLSGGETILKRKKQTVYVDEKGLKLKSNDKLIIENTILEVIIIDKIE